MMPMDTTIEKLVNAALKLNSKEVSIRVRRIDQEHLRVEINARVDERRFADAIEIRIADWPELADAPPRFMYRRMFYTLLDALERLPSEIAAIAAAP